jgi:carboxypeptidase Q
VKARFESLAIRLAETNLLRLANASPPRSTSTQNASSNAAPNVATRRNGPAPGQRAAISETSPETSRGRSGRAGGPGRRGGPPSGQFTFQTRVLSFLASEQAALAVSPSGQGDGGTFFVSAASVPGSGSRTNSSAPNTPRISAWSTNAPPILPQITLAIEDYNRLARMIQFGEKLKMAVDFQSEFHNDDLMAYNTIAEIPGSDLKEEVVMLGGHLDSWHSGTGATDNGAGVVAAMEAMRILQALKLQPRRTIRIGLWTGEEQGLLGSRAYVAQRFGYYTNISVTLAANSRDENSAGGASSEPAPTNSVAKRTLVRLAEYERLSAYFNLDNGTGKIRGVYMQGNEAVRPIFRSWLQPFSDLGAETLSLSNTGGTDHLSFDDIGLPGFQFIQDPIEYNTRTHHSNADVFDRIQADDLKQASIIMATFAYNAAMVDEKIPRKPTSQ